MASGNCRVDPASAPTNGRRRRRRRRPPSRVEREQHPQLFQVTPRCRRQGGGGGGGYRSSGSGLSTTLLVVTVVVIMVIKIRSTGSGDSGSLRGVVGVSASPVGCGECDGTAAACVATTTMGTGRHPCGETGTETALSSNRSYILESITSLPPLPMGADGTYERQSPLPPPRAVAATRTFRQLWDGYGCDKDIVDGDGVSYPSSRGDEEAILLAHGEEGWGPLPGPPQRRPIPDADTWRYLRAAYNRVVRSQLCDPSDVQYRNHGNGTAQRQCYVEGVDVNTVSDDDEDDDEDAYRENDIYRHDQYPSSADDVLTYPYRSGFKVPVVVQYSPGKGRGVFATANIPRGTLVWVSQYEGWMTSGDLYRHLLDSLPTHALRCEVMTFSYFSINGIDDDDASTAAEDDDEECDDGDADEEDCTAPIPDEAYDLTDGDNVQVRPSVKTNRDLVGDEDNQVISKVLFDEEEEWDDGEGEEEVEWDDGEDEEEEEEWGDGEDEKEDEEWDDGEDEQGLGDGDAKDDWWWEGGDEEEWGNEVDHPCELPANIILVALDEAALMNADWESPDGQQNVNVGTRSELVYFGLDVDADGEREGEGRILEDEEDGKPWVRYVAFRDIEAGEEIVCAYHDFVTNDAGWAHFGL